MDYKKFLEKISQLESSGGKNTRHKPINKGLQKGQTAMGKYGLLPNTAEELVRRAKNEGTMVPELEAIEGLDQRSISNKVNKDPSIEDELAFRLYDHISQQTKDPEKMAYMWNSGHNRNPASMEHEEVVDDPYVQKFRKEVLKDKKLVGDVLANTPVVEDPRIKALEKLSRGL